MNINNNYNRHTLGNAKQKRIDRIERINPIQKIIRLLNQYHSIDLMYATTEEKEWAKRRLYNQIMKSLDNCSDDIKGTIKASIKSKEIWEKTRDILS